MTGFINPGGIGLRRVAAVALETALAGDEPSPRRRLSGARAIVAGVVLATAARVQ